MGYLRRRPASGESRAMFLKVLAPARPSARLWSGVVRERARGRGPVVGAHGLRHTAATEMLRAGASLSEIAQVLRASPAGDDRDLRQGRSPRSGCRRCRGREVRHERCYGRPARLSRSPSPARIQLKRKASCWRASSASCRGAARQNVSRPSWRSVGEAARGRACAARGASDSGSCVALLATWRRSTR